MPEYVLAVDIGGTKIAAALADRDDVLVRREVASTPGLAGPAAVIATVVALAERMLAGSDPGCANPAGTGRSGADLAGADLLGAGAGIVLAGVGIGTAGVVDTGRGRIVSATDTLADWAGTPLADLVRASLGSRLADGAPVAVQNDVDAHAAGEYRHGAAVGASSVLVVAVGTGVGSGVIVNGVPLRGAHHVAGEIAHAPARGAEHLRCPCGRSGHLESLGSGIGMHRHFLSLGGSASIVDARGVAAAASSGDAIAGRALDESAASVGRAIAAAATLLDPERVVITGGVPNIGEAWWSPMRAAYRAEVIDALQHTPILPGLLGDDAPLRGAAASAWRSR